MNSRTDISKSIYQVLIPFCDCIAWEDFSDRGNSRYDPYYFHSPEEEEEAASARANVLMEIPKGGGVHNILLPKIAGEFGNRRIHYDWFVKAVSRVLAITTYDKLLSLSTLCRETKNGGTLSARIRPRSDGQRYILAVDVEADREG